MGQPEQGNDTSPGQAGMELIEATPHYHPPLAEIWTYPAEELAALIH
jgi:ABC-type cobalt transport system substrate-binding protein